MTYFSRRRDAFRNAGALVIAAAAGRAQAAVLPGDLQGSSAPAAALSSQRMITPRDFGAVADGRADDTNAIQKAIAYACSARNKTVHLPNGQYKVSGLITVPQGVMIRGEGSQGSGDGYGTVIKQYSNASCFRFDGSGADFAGTGGGLENVLILKAEGFSGGNAIELVAVNDAHRPGEMMLTNILAYGRGSGRWARGLLIDGTACNTPGARGVRTVSCRKVRFADTTIPGESVLLNQATSFFAHGLAVDGGGGTGPGITIKGISGGIFLNGLSLGGSFTIVANDAANGTSDIHIDGKVSGAFANNDAQADGTVQLSGGGGVANKSKFLRIISAKNPGFCVHRVTAASNVTGDGTAYPVVFDATDFDELGNFSGRNQFVCGVAGKYLFESCLLLTGLETAHTRADLSISQVGSLNRAAVQVVNPFAVCAAGQASISTSTILDLAYGDVVRIRVSVSGGAKSVNVHGAVGSQYSWCSGKYLA